jgi:hypothetical protein
MKNRRGLSGSDGSNKAQKVEATVALAADPEEAVKMLEYINASWTAFHAVGGRAQLFWERDRAATV